jgi:hypothetical protein
MLEPFVSPRTFRIWLYTVTHGTLLLRSVKEPGLPTRVDVIFKPVRYVRMPTTLVGLAVHSVLPSELHGELAESVGAVDPEDKVFALAGPRGDAWVVSGVMGWHEDEGGDFEPSHFSVPQMVW